MWKIAVIFLLNLLEITLSQPLRHAQPRANGFDSYAAFESAINATRATFWDTQRSAWNAVDPDCESTSYKVPDLWTLAVVSRAETRTGNYQNSDNVAKLIMKYKDSSSDWLFATPGGDEIYVDDNCQALWVLLDAYDITKDKSYLSAATNLMQLIRSQWSSQTGGVFWLVGSTYLSSISTTEAALSAIIVYEHTKDDGLIQFAEDCMSWMFAHLQDSEDKLFYDGMDVNGEVDKGKLTYTVGVALSTLARLYKITGNYWWIGKALEIGNAAIDKKGVFYTSDGYWNNQFKYSHLLFAGFYDLLKLVDPSGNDQEQAFEKYTTEMSKQAQYVFDYFQIDNTGLYYHNALTYTLQAFKKYTESFETSVEYSPNSAFFCNGDVNGKPKRSLMDNGSVSQIFFYAALQ